MRHPPKPFCSAAPLFSAAASQSDNRLQCVRRCDVRAVRVTMSIKYAESLRKGVDYGPCGAIEKYDSERVLAKKMAQLAELVRESGHCVVHTGAGISTACSIPDFRGPRGVWTLERAGEKLPPPSVLFVNAVPSLTHMAIVGLLRAGKVRYVISQNVDGLHLRYGGLGGRGRREEDGGRERRAAESPQPRAPCKNNALLSSLLLMFLLFP